MTNSQNDDPRSAFPNAKKLTGNGICGQFFCISKYEFEGFQGFDIVRHSCANRGVSHLQMQMRAA